MTMAIAKSNSLYFPAYRVGEIIANNMRRVILIQTCVDNGYISLYEAQSQW